MGRIEHDFWPNASGRWMEHQIRVRLSFGAFASKSEAEVLAGANALALETPAGFEILQFRDAALGADGVWTLTGLLRGQFGTEDRAALAAVAGARVVLLNAALAEARYPLSLIGQMVSFEAGPEREWPGGENFAAATLALSARPLMPLSPVHLRADAASGGIMLSWIRRTRLGGDRWEGEVPLGEAYERYRVRVFADAAAANASPPAPLRSFDVYGPFAPAAGSASLAEREGRPHVLYTDDMILADFGAGGLDAAPDAVFEVAQLSDLVGEGARARKSL
jgi:hypothetical protein